MSINNGPAYVASETQKRSILGFISEAGHVVDYTTPDEIKQGDCGVSIFRAELKNESIKFPGSVCITNDQLEGLDDKGWVICSPKLQNGDVDLERSLVFTIKFVRAYLAIARGYRERHQWTGDDGTKYRVFEFVHQAHNGYTLKEFRSIL